MLSYRKLIEKKKKKGMMTDPSYIATDRRNKRDCESEEPVVTEQSVLPNNNKDLNSSRQFSHDTQNKAMRTKKAKKNKGEEEGPDHKLILLKAKKILKEERNVGKKINHFTITDFLGGTKYKNIQKAERTPSLYIPAAERNSNVLQLKRKPIKRTTKKIDSKKAIESPSVSEIGHTTDKGNRYYASTGKELDPKKRKLKRFVEFGKKQYSDTGEKIGQHALKLSI